ncbi:serine hydrolase domain-containing protein [Colwellia psychrerythraea]|uniref:Beta-lactamase n=1 Tax=Colwellia psychrerythraea TaxID=28229 RepID=A0A099KLW4_COLPS|nr:serine hydrolase [Colwellia psychrerythraea]KGJ91220.1 beta-lactamase [Colwellia psychrerythraea]
MNINFTLKKLIAVALLVSFSSFAEESAINSTEKNNSRAPEVTTAEASISFWDLPYLKEAFIDSTPADRKDGLVVGDLVANGGNKAMIMQLSQEIADQKHGKYDSLLIARHGKLVFESYYLRGRVNLPHMQASITKAYTSLLVGRAIQLGYLTMADLDKPLVNFLKDLDSTKFVGGVEKITLHKALTMSSGLRFSEEQFKKFRGNRSQFKGLDQIQAYLELSAPITSESQIYKYQGPDPIIVMQVLDAVVPGSAKDFIKNELLNKVGISIYSWRNDLSALPTGDSGSSMTSRDMIKLGTLVINNGKWNGEQLISEKFLAAATKGITKATEDWQPDSFNYGYFWYQTDSTVGDKSYDAKIAWGAGGQRIITVEALDLIVVITGHDREDTIMTQLSKIILPAFVK